MKTTTTRLLITTTALALVFLAALLAPRAAAWQSKLVGMDANGKLTYNPDPATGSRIADFSHAGYHGGDLPLPIVGAGPNDIPVKVTVNPVTGDNTSNIQNAINQVNAMPLLANGYRGAVHLNSGTYTLSGTLVLNTSGVVLQGSGTSTVLYNTFSGTTVVSSAGYTIITVTGNVSGSPFNNNTTGSTTITGTVPVGANSFNVSSASGYNVGDLVLVMQPWTDNWLKTVDWGGTNTLGYGGTTDPNNGGNPAWTTSNGAQRYQRYITAINGNTITIDAPVFENLDTTLAPATLVRYTATGTSNYHNHIGIENLLIDNAYANATDENHAQNSIVFKRVTDCWARGVTTQHFTHAGILFMDASTRSTVVNCNAVDPIGVATGERFYNFGTERAQLILFTQCYARGARHSYVCNGTSLDAGIVFHNSVGDKPVSTAEPHRLWTNGILYDNIHLTNHSQSWALGLYNRGSMGTSHGWATAYSVAWNCATSNGKSISIQRPKDTVAGTNTKDTGASNGHGAQNYGIGCMIYSGTGCSGTLGNAANVTGNGAYNPSSYPYIQAGYIEGSNQAGLEPASLYDAQLAARGAPAAPVAPTLTAVTPTSAKVGDTLAITGTNLAAAAAVTIGGVAATITSNDGATLKFTVPAGATTGTIVVSTPGGSATSTQTVTITATPPPADPVLTVDKIMLSLAQTAGATGTAALTSNIAWTTRIDPATATWLAVVPNASTGNATLTGTAATANATTTPRTASIVVSGSSNGISITRTLIATQAALGAPGLAPAGTTLATGATLTLTTNSAPPATATYTVADNNKLTPAGSTTPITYEYAVTGSSAATLLIDSLDNVYSLQFTNTAAGNLTLYTVDANGAPANFPGNFTYTLPAAPTYTLIVKNGSSNFTSYAAGATVTITASAAPSGQVFNNWTSTPSVAFANANATPTTFIMPANAVTVTANYKAQPTTGGGSGNSSSGGGGGGGGAPSLWYLTATLALLLLRRRATR